MGVGVLVQVLLQQTGGARLPNRGISPSAQQATVNAAHANYEVQRMTPLNSGNPLHNALSRLGASIGP